MTSTVPIDILADALFFKFLAEIDKSLRHKILCPHIIVTIDSETNIQIDQICRKCHADEYFPHFIKKMHGHYLAGGLPQSEYGGSNAGWTYDMITNVDFLICFIRTMHESYRVDIHFDNEYLLSTILSRNGNEHLVKYLLSIGCDFDVCYRTHRPYILKSIDMLSVLIDNVCDVSFLFDPENCWNHFMNFIDTYDMDQENLANHAYNFLNKLITKGYKPDVHTVHHVFVSGYNAAIKLLIETDLAIGYDCTEALMRAVQSNNNEVVKLLAGCGIDWELIEKNQCHEKQQIFQSLLDSGHSYPEILKLLSAKMRWKLI
jgi:hypothetical protein